MGDYSLVGALDKMKKFIKDAVSLVDEFEEGNDESGVLIRKKMQEVKSVAQEIRTQIQIEKRERIDKE